MTTKTRSELLLEILNDKEWHVSTELASTIGIGFAARLNELKRQGYNILSRPTQSYPTFKEYKLDGKGEPRDAYVRILLSKHQAEKMLSCSLPDDLREIIADALRRRVDYERWE